MLKRLVWTFIIFGPIMFAGLWSVFAGDTDALQLFNAGAIFEHTSAAWNNLKSLFGEDKQWLGFIWEIILTAYFIMPFLFVWRGLFFLGWIPLLGGVLRIVALTLIIAVPSLLAGIIGNAGVADANMYIEAFTLILVFLGIWLPKSITTK